jgi:hypothetical protein
MTDQLPLLPHDTDAYDPRAPQKPQPATLGSDAFAYIGTPLNVLQFQTYISSYDFGSIPPDYIVLHHTANPAASWAPLANAPNWDRAESGLPDDLIRAKRKHQLDGIMAYYRDSLGWTAGPHLFIDERYIWLFSPMSEVGIHAKWGNSFKQAGVLHYSIGIEVVGNYDRVVWPADVIRNVRGAVQALQHRLGTFALRYLYPTNKPGMVGVGTAQKCAHPDRLRFGGIASHRDFNKPACPGSAITEQFYIAALTSTDPPPPPPTPASPLASYRVRAGVTAGATIRASARRSAANRGTLRAGDRWNGTPIRGELVSLEGFQTSDIWICDAASRCVWSGLLEVVL